MLRKSALPSAKREFADFCRDYGEPFCTDAREWTDQLVAAASRGRPLPTASVDALLEEILEQGDSIAAEAGRWRYALARFHRAGMLERIRALLATLRTRKPPWELVVANRVFYGLSGSLPIELEAYFEVKRADREVVFIKFEVYSVR